MKKHTLTILVGLMNFLHGMFHLIQVVQSMILLAYTAEHHHHEHIDESILDKIMHSPILAVVWVIVGVSTMIMGIRDYRHHKKCHTH